VRKDQKAPATPKEKKSRTEIPFEAKKQAYIYAKLVQNGNLHMTQAVKELVENHGWNSAGSAQIYIAGIKCLFEGRGYGKDMSRDAIEYFLEQIQHDYREDGLRRALNALQQRIEYLRNKNFPGHEAGLRRIYDAWTNR
jgi:hypothetical protein